MQKQILTLFSCDYLKGFVTIPEDYLLSTRLSLLQSLGKFIANKNKTKRLTIIRTVNEALIKPQLISIILPVFNAEETIKNTIESIQKQTYSHWELLVIDDGSTDKSNRIIKKLVGLDSRIRLYKNTENKGAAYARNVGLYFAKGDFITFHDADDTSHFERLEYQLSTLFANKRLQLVVAQYVRVNSKKEVLVLNNRKKRNYVSGMMFSRKLIDKVGYFKPLRISEDSEYHERILATYGKQSRKVLCKTLYYALFNPDSLLFSNADVKISGNSINYKIHKDELDLLEAFRVEHKRIAAGELSPHQGFKLDKTITTDPHE